jgi:hypothetical protein
MSDDDLVGQLTVYYNPPGGEEGFSSFVSGGEYGSDFGHVFVEVIDLRTGENHYLDIWEQNGEAYINRELDDTRRERGESASWGITEEQLESATQAIEARLSSSTPYNVFNGSCVDSVREVLQAAGYDVPDSWFPSNFWNDIQELSDANQSLGSPNSFDGGIPYTDLLESDIVAGDVSPADSSEPNICDGEERYVPPPPTVSDPNISGSEQNATPSNANTCSPDGHEIHIDSPESKQSFTQPDANMSSSDGYEVRADSSSSMSSPASYDPGGNSASDDASRQDEHDYTPSDANYTDDLGHSTHEGDFSSSSSMSSPASYDPGGNSAFNDASGQDGHDSSEGYEDNSASDDASGQDEHDYTPSDANYTDDLGHSTHEGDFSSSSSMSSPASYDPGGNSAFNDASGQDGHDSSEGYEDNSASDDASGQDEHDYTPSDANYTDDLGHSTHEGDFSSSSSMSSPASYDPGGNSASNDASGQDGHDSSEGYEDNSASDDASGQDEHDYTPSDANYTDDLGHSTHEGDFSSSSSMSSPASYDPGGNSASNDASGQDGHDSSKGYEDNSASNDASRQDGHDSSKGYEDNSSASYDPSGNSASNDASRQDGHDSSKGYEDNSSASYDPSGNSASNDASRQDGHDSSEGYEDNSSSNKDYF